MGGLGRRGGGGRIHVGILKCILVCILVCGLGRRVSWEGLLVGEEIRWEAVPWGWAHE